MPKRLSKIDPLDIDELFRSPSLEGMLSFRDVDPATAIDRYKAKTALDSESLTKPKDQAETLAPIGAVPIGKSDVKSGSTEKPPGVAMKDPGQPPTPIRLVPTGVNADAPSEADLGRHLSTADILAEVHDASRTSRSRGRILRATKVEDGHSSNENSLYWYLWRTGREIRNSRSHFVQIGYALISKAVGLDRTNVQNILRSLEVKLALRVVTPGTVKSSTVYEIFSCEQILAQRKDSNLLWVRRFGSRRVDFVDDQGNPLPPTGATPIGTSPRVGVTPPDPVSVVLPEPVGIRPTQLVTEHHEETTTSSDMSETDPAILPVSQALNQYVPPDHDGVRAIIRDVRRIVPNASPDEIVYFIHAKGMVVRSGKIQNPMGFFITTVPNCFKGSTFQEFRRKQAHQLALVESQAAQAGLELDAFYEQQARIAGDPNASEEEKTFAQKMLSERENDGPMESMAT